MLIKRADAMGMCFGVRDALSAIEAVEHPRDVTIHGELVHNSQVLNMLNERGFEQSAESTRRIPNTPTVLITAHGVSDRERARLRGAGKALLDTTCPLVQKAHDAAKDLQSAGRRVIVLGKPDHVEVLGIVEDLRDPIVVRGEADVERWPETGLGVICQTTTASEHVRKMIRLIRCANPHADVLLVDTVCNPTKARGEALEALLPQIDALVVVGGRDSNNTRQLVLRGQRFSLPTLHVEHEDELRQEWFRGYRVVGLTAGTSTLPATIDAVFARLESLGSGATTGSLRLPRECG
jgi:4-hydroxy-3-methylbut-2-en-1-yl diphosphate reductase